MTRTATLLWPALLLGACPPAYAQSGAMWVDDVGRMMSLGFGGGDGAPPRAMPQTADEMARSFKQICLDSGANPSADAVPYLTATPVTIPAGKKEPPIVLNVLRGGGMVVSQTDGFFAARIAQCNITFYTDTLPSRDELSAALGAIMGSAPSNASDAVKKNGEPNKYWSPQWKTTIAGTPWVLSAFVVQGSRDMPGSRVQITVRSEKKAGK